jgi:hypothetical protein
MLHNVATELLAVWVGGHIILLEEPVFLIGYIFKKLSQDSTKYSNFTVI